MRNARVFNYHAGTKFVLSDIYKLGQKTGFSLDVCLAAVFALDDTPMEIRREVSDIANQWWRNDWPYHGRSG